MQNRCDTCGHCRFPGKMKRDLNETFIVRICPEWNNFFVADVFAFKVECGSWKPETLLNIMQKNYNALKPQGIKYKLKL